MYVSMVKIQMIRIQRERNLFNMYHELRQVVVAGSEDEKGGRAKSHKLRMKKTERLFYIFILVFIIGIICWTADALTIYWMYSCWMTVTGLVGLVVTDSILRSNDADLAELLREEREEQDEAA